MLEDKSEDFAETWKFLDRRFEDVGFVGNTMSMTSDLAQGETMCLIGYAVPMSHRSTETILSEDLETTNTFLDPSMRLIFAIQSCPSLDILQLCI